MGCLALRCFFFIFVVKPDQTVHLCKSSCSQQELHNRVITSSFCLLCRKATGKLIIKRQVGFLGRNPACRLKINFPSFSFLHIQGNRNGVVLGPKPLDKMTRMLKTLVYPLTCAPSLSWPPPRVLELVPCPVDKLAIFSA